MQRRRSEKKWEAENKLDIPFLSAPLQHFELHEYITCTAHHLAIASEECFVCCRLVLPFRERNNFIQLSKNTIQKLYPFHNFSLRFIRKVFLKCRKFQSRYSYKIYSYIKERV